MSRLWLALAVAFVPLSGWPDEEDHLDPHPQVIKKEPSSWRANLFVGSALVAFATGIVVICLDGGTSNGATYRLNHPTPNPEVIE